MRKFASLGIVLAALLAGGVAGAVEKLSPVLQLWLEDVSPIVTRTEREVFLKLQTNADRDKFVRFFWRMRDPYPDTTENEFQKEYMERVQFADRNFGRQTSKRGSQTDRGFFYLVLGPPLERHFYTTNSQVWPLELWFYKGAVEYGLPDYFYLIFYQPEGIGDFRLYSPSVEGPEKLAVPIMGGQNMSRAQAVEFIRRVDGELASASQSYLPGESPAGFSSFSSDTIIASVRRLPEKKFTDNYARSFMTFKDYVETEYSDSFIQSAFQVKVFRTAGQPFVHWSIEPEKMNFGMKGGAIYASFELVLRLEDPRGRLIYEKVEEIPLTLTAEQYKSYSGRRFAFQDLLAVVPGEHKALFLLKNKTGKDFSSFEAKFVAPETGRTGLSVPLLFYAGENVPEAQKNNLKAFVFGGRQYLVGARNEFIPSGSLGVFLQAWNLDKLGLAARPSFILEITSIDTNQSVGIIPLSDAAADPGDPSTLLVSGAVPLKDIKPGYYRAEISVQSADGRKHLTEQENFVVLSAAAPVVPQAYARLHGPYPGPEHSKVLGSQYFLSGDFGLAREAFERVLAVRDDPAARLLLAKSLYGLGLFRESLAQAGPLYERAPDREAAKVIALDYAGLKDWNSALSYLEKLMAEATEIPVLNLAAECLLALDRPEQALPLLQKSLSLLPDQPAVKALEEKTKKQVDKK